MNKFLAVTFLVFTITACDQQNSHSTAASSTKSAEPEPNERLFDFYGFSTCTTATREDIINNFRKNQATNIKTTIDKNYDITSIDGNIVNDSQSFKLSVTLWSGRILSLSISDYSSKFTAEFNKIYGLPVDEINEYRGSIDINKKLRKNPTKNTSASFNTVNLSGYKSSYFEFICIPINNEYEIKFKQK